MKMIRKNFTLFEILISTALLIILTVVLLRMFVLTGDYWHYTEGQNDIYLDNKILFNLMNDELSNIVYDYSNAAAADKFHAPLYIGTFDHGVSGTIKYPAPSGSGYTTKELNKGITLCFVTRTKRDSDAEHSDIAKVAYVFYPPIKDSANYTFLNDSRVPGKKNGVVVRMILDEDDATKFTGDQTMGKYYEFDLNQGKQVIDGVLDFQVTAYKYNTGDTDEKLTKADASSGNEGVKNVRAVVVTMTMLPPDKMAEYKRVYQDKSQTEQNDFLQKYSRTFRRTFWISPVNSAD